MRDIVVVAFVLAAAGYAIAHPYVGVLAWNWVSIMNPHRLAWGFAVNFPVALLVAIGTLLGLVVSRDPKRLPLVGPVLALLLFIFWMVVTSALAIYPSAIWDMFSRVMKIMAMVLVSMMVLKTRRHIELLIWVLALSIGFYGLKGGVFTVVGGGEFRVWGPEGSFIEGNNEMALAMIITIPLMRFLQQEASSKWVRWGLGTAMVLTALAALGSHSRGALLAIVAMAALLWFRSENKVVTGALLMVIGIALVAFMPEHWEARMRTIGMDDADGSAQGRINAWMMAWNLAVDRPIGGGFEVITPELFAKYAPNPLDVHAAHSIYFQVLGEHGFVGLALFLVIWWNVWRWAGQMYGGNGRAASAVWSRRLGGMIQVSLIGYLVGGAFLSLAYFDLPYNLLVLVVVGKAVVRGDVREAKAGAPGGAIEQPPSQRAARSRFA